MPATVLDNVTPAMRIYAEETFGPVVIVLRAERRGRGRADRQRQRLRAWRRRCSGATWRARLRSRGGSNAGICHVNAATVYDEPQMPFGGTKASGYGRFGGKAAVEHFTELRTITIAIGTAGVSVLMG